MKTLKEYARNRNFNVTPEPAGGAPVKRGSPGGLAPGEQADFYIQRHDASRLHYDFRLELEGVLKSWAVPKGPTLDPNVRRLAMMVEDHPVSYGTFEGNIPQGEYGGGSVMLWDRGVFTLLGTDRSDVQTAAGNLKFALHGTKLSGEFALVRMKNSKAGNEWLLIKKKDAAARQGWKIEAFDMSVLTEREQTGIAKETRPKKNVKMPRNIEPMLSEPTETLPDGPEWVYEVKWDGVRALCYVSDGAIEIRSRTGGQLFKQFPELATIDQGIRARNAILDGEIVAIDETGLSHFQWLQPRITLSRRRTVPGSDAGRIQLVLFDALFLDGEDLRELPLEKRVQRLKAAVVESEVLKISGQFSGAAEDVVKAAEELGLEGIIAKRTGSKYKPGRSSLWKKFKLQLRQEFLICGWLSGNRKPFGSLVLGVNEPAGLRWCGNVGTGFDEKSMAHLAELLTKRKTKQRLEGEWPKAMVTVQPELICEVKFAQWTSGGKLRAPVYLGLRKDARPAEVRREAVGIPQLLGSRDESASISLNGKQLQLSHLNKLYFPKDGITKRELLNYYSEVSPYLLPHLENRPLSLRRYPGGIEGKCFFQKNLPESAPGWIQTIDLLTEQSKRKIRYCLCPDTATLLYLVNLGCVDHNPWMSRIQNLDSPDYLLIDLDANGVKFDLVIESAWAVKELLDELRLSALLKTSGGDGLHLMIPLEAGQGYDRAKLVAEQMAQVASTRFPKLITQERSISKRPKGRVYFDHMQVGKGKTIASAYSVRPHPKAPVSTPLRWEELQRGLEVEDFHIGNTMQRLKSSGDVWGQDAELKFHLD